VNNDAQSMSPAKPLSFFFVDYMTLYYRVRREYFLGALHSEKVA
jgi:hypothetical protein